MDWFERITGFPEMSYGETQRRLRLDQGVLVAEASGRRSGVGLLETPSLAELRQRVAGVRAAGRRSTLSCLAADARQLHGDATNAGALFQVASQFNLLEMVGPGITPEHGVTRYETDGTQGPACAMAAGAATIYRNYLVPINGGIGQRRNQQIDCIFEVGQALGNHAESLWRMRNGYALFTLEGLRTVDERLTAMGEPQLDALRARLRIGLHSGVEVTDVPTPGHRVSQAFCSALPVSYNRDIGASPRLWTRFATLVLEAAYEATLLAGCMQAAAGGSNVVYLTRLGGGAFGNEVAWIHAAIARAVQVHRDSGLDIRIVTRDAVDAKLAAFVRENG